MRNLSLNRGQKYSTTHKICNPWKLIILEYWQYNVDTLLNVVHYIIDSTLFRAGIPLVLSHSPHAIKKNFFMTPVFTKQKYHKYFQYFLTFNCQNQVTIFQISHNLGNCYVIYRETKKDYLSKRSFWSEQ